MELSDLKEKARAASGEAALEARIKTAAERTAAQGRDFFADIIPTLKLKSIPQSEIDRLTAALAKSTDRNKTLARLLVSCTGLYNALHQLI